MKNMNTKASGAAESREYNSETLNRALDRRSAIKYQLKWVTDTMNYLENLQSEMEAKEVEGVEYSQEEWECFSHKCAWEQRLLDSLEMDTYRSDTELETVYSMMNESKMNDKQINRKENIMKNMNTKANGAAESCEYSSQADNNLSDQKIAEAMTMTIRELNPEVTVETDFLRDSVAPMQLGNIDDAKKTAKGIAEYCAKNKVKKFGMGDLMNLSWAPKESKSEATVLGAHFSKDKSVVPTFEPEDMAGLVIGEMENSDFNPELTEDCHNHLVAFFFDEGKECCTFANAQFVARRILCESRINGSDCVFDSEDFSESQGSYGPSEEAWDKYIEPQTASL